MSNISLSEYAGIWYQIAAFPNEFTFDKAFNTTATYTVTPDGIHVLNTHYLLASDGSLLRVDAEGTAISKSHDNRRLAVRFDEAMPYITNYIIEAIDPQYTFSVVTNPQRDHLYILSRYSVITMKDYTHLTNNLALSGFDVSKLIPTTHFL